MQLCVAPVEGKTKDAEFLFYLAGDNFLDLVVMGCGFVQVRSEDCDYALLVLAGLLADELGLAHFYVLRLELLHGQSPHLGCVEHPAQNGPIAAGIGHPHQTQPEEVHLPDFVDFVLQNLLRLHDAADIRALA